MLKELGIEIERYVALEIDPDSVKVAVGKGQRVGYLIPPL